MKFHRLVLCILIGAGIAGLSHAFQLGYMHLAYAGKIPLWLHYTLIAVLPPTAYWGITVLIQKAKP